MKKFACYFIYTLLLAAIACACSDNLDIKQSYEFKVTHLPVPGKLKKGETVEIRFQLERSGWYENTGYFFRYFQFEGAGRLAMDDGTVFLPNDYYDLERETFRMYYTSLSEQQQEFSIYWFDNMGNSGVSSFEFNNDSSQQDEP